MAITESGQRAESTRNGNTRFNGTDGRVLNESPVTDVVEPIAIIGFSFEFAEDATSVNKFWAMLEEKRNAMKEWPEDRLNFRAFHHPDGTRQGSFPVRGAHFMKEELGAFDAPFFSITSKEAHSMDPQHRRMLETAYKAFENAGMPLESILGSKTSVYTGCFSDDWKVTMAKDSDDFPDYHATSTSLAILANRLSWFFNLTGPSVNFDSACSSSMMALDVACQSLRNRDSETALVGGSNMIISPDVFTSLTSMNFLSKDGLCYSFDSRANGYARGEGNAAIVLKRMSDAIRDKNIIRAVIRSTGSNQDGRTPGITQPSQRAQESLIRETYAKAGLDMATTRYVEAHGTGTAIGDSLEAGAICQTFGKYSSSAAPLYVGAVKSNIGHLEGASGLAGIIKTVMILERGIIPPNANFKQINPRIDLASTHIKFPQTNIAWPSSGIRRASVNSFGFGGTNSHAVLEDAYHYLTLRGLLGYHYTTIHPSQPESAKKKIAGMTYTSTHPSPKVNGNTNGFKPFPVPKIFIFTASDKEGLSRLARVYSEYLIDIEKAPGSGDEFLESLAHTLAVQRSSLPWKSFIISSDITTLTKMDLTEPVRPMGAAALAYVFTGQGAQHPGMGNQLLVYPAFRRSISKSNLYFREMGCQWSLIDELSHETDTLQLSRPEYSQPICTALQIALVDLMRSFGIRPSVVTGHSSGEIAAAYSVGGLSHQSACKVAFFRGLYTGNVAASDKFHGCMMSVGLSKGQVSRYLSSDDKVAVACVNSPQNITLSGDEGRMNEISAALEQDGVFVRKLQVNVAYHTRQMEKISASYGEMIRNLVEGEPSDIRMVSSVTGETISLDRLSTAAYWLENLISPVQFYPALTTLISDSRKGQGARSSLSLLEIGPHGALRLPIREILQKIANPKISEPHYDSLLARGKPALETFLSAIGHLSCRGHNINIDKVNRSHGQYHNTPPPVMNAPSYPFNHSQSYWHESRLSKEGYRLRNLPALDLLGTPTPDWNPQEAKWRRFVTAARLPWIEDHKINGVAIYPAAGFMVMAIEGIKQLLSSEHTCTGYTLKDVTFNKPLKVGYDVERLETQLCLRSSGAISRKSTHWSEFRIFSNTHNQWLEHCSGKIRAEFGNECQKPDQGFGWDAGAQLQSYLDEFRQLSERNTRPVDKQRIYQDLQLCGFDYGPEFHVLKDISASNDTEAVASIKVFDWSLSDEKIPAQPHVVHPTTLDAGAQLMIVALAKGGLRTIPTVIPTRVNKLWVSNDGINCSDSSIIRAYSKARMHGERKATATTVFLDQDLNRVLADIEMENTVIGGQTAAPTDTSSQLCYKVQSKPDVELLDKAEMQALFRRYSPDNTSGTVPFKALDLAQLSVMSDALVSLDESANFETNPNLKTHMDWMSRSVSEASTKYSIESQVAKYYGDKENLYRLVENHSTGGKAYMTLGRNLGRILSGETEPLDLLREANLADDYHRIYTQGNAHKDALKQYFDLLTHKKANMRILEIGVGSATMTASVLECLATQSDEDHNISKYASYELTDISSDALEGARRNLASLGVPLQFNVLDIEGDMAAQGFVCGTYDLIIADKVLHATKDLVGACKNVRDLLKPGGKLLLEEIVENTHRWQHVFGALPGWCSGEEDFRKDGPYIPTEKWNEILVRAGFSGVDHEFLDSSEPECHEYSTILSTAIREGRDMAKFAATNLILGAETPPHQRLAGQLKEALVEKGVPRCNILSLRQAAGEAGRSKTFSVLLTDFGRPFLSNLNPESFEHLQRIVTKARKVLWVSAGDPEQASPESRMVEGFARVLRNELGYLHLTTLILERGGISDETHLQNIIKVSMSIMGTTDTGYETEYEVKNGVLEISRVVPDRSLTRKVQGGNGEDDSQICLFGSKDALQLKMSRPGFLDSAEFEEDLNHMRPVGPTEVEIEVAYTGINFKDCLTALGQGSTNGFGGECAGNISRVGAAATGGFQPGDRVIVAGPFNTYRTFVRCAEEYVTKVPDHLPLSEAGAIPVNFITAHYAFVEVARIQCNESVLVHLGSGGTGQAAIQLALHLGATVFTTVGSLQKKQFLVETYGLPEDHIFSSRDALFAEGIKCKTHGRGVDVVLNSLAGDALEASWNCMASFGRFIEIGKKDVLDRANLPMLPFSHNVSFAVVDVEVLLRERPLLGRRSLQAVLDLMTAGSLSVPNPLTIHGIGEVEKAFRSFQNRSNIGKMVVQMRSDELVRVNTPANRSCKLDEGATYLIAGGLGGLGRTIARWMVTRGAKHLILLSRKGAVTGEAVELIEELKGQGINVEAPPCDIASLETLQRTLVACAITMPPIRGCVQSTMVIKDSFFETMQFDGWIEGIRPKVDGSWNLHCQLPPDMDFFLMLSSISGITGFGAQTNYAAGNTYEDALAHYRVSHGQQATSLDLGWMQSEGVIAGNTYMEDLMARVGCYLPISTPEFYRLLDIYCKRHDPGERKPDIQRIVGLETPSGMKAKAIANPPWMDWPTFCHMEHQSSSLGPTEDPSVITDGYGDLLQKAEKLEDAVSIIQQGLVEKLSKAMMLQETHIDTSKSLYEYGVDSLTAIELRNWAAKELQADVALFELLSEGPFDVRLWRMENNLDD